MHGPPESCSRSVIPRRVLARGKRVVGMTRFVLQWRHAWWKLILLRFVLYSSAATGQLAATSSGINFGSVQLGGSSTLSVTVSNSGKYDLTISQATVTGTGFSFAGPGLPITLAPQQNANLSLTFAPQVSGIASGGLSVAASTPIGNSGKQRLSSTLISLSGAGTSSGTATEPGYLSPNPSSLNFGSIQAGSSQTQYVAVTNSGSSSVTISAAATIGSGFSLSGFTAPETLAAGQSLTVTVAFAPTASGSSSGALTFTSNASDSTLSVLLSGTGTSPGQLTVSPGTMGFGTVVVGSSQTQTGTLSATGSSVTISSGSSGSSEFALGGLTLPVTVPAGQSIPFTVTFSPQSSGTASSDVAFSSNASTPSIAEAVTGTGASTVQHSVDLSWNPSTSSVVGYNVYRGSNAGGPYSRINTSLDSTTGYTDSTVQSGQTYYYVTTAVDSSSVESGYSNEVPVVVPTP